MKIVKINKNSKAEATWDVEVPDGHEYILPNGVVSHNTSSQILNSTNGIEPIRSLVTRKASKDGVLTQVAPESEKLKNKYDILWEQQTPQGYLEVCAVLQKYIDQGISANTSYNPQLFDNARVPMMQVLKDILTAYKLGLKSLYYSNTMDNAKEVDIDKLLEEKENKSNNDSDNPVLKFLKKDSDIKPKVSSSYDFTSSADDNDCKDGCSI